MKPVHRCRRCEEEIPRTAAECPECGYCPQSIVRRFGAAALIFGAAITLVSPPIGLLGVFVGAVAIPGSYLASPAR